MFPLAHSFLILTILKYSRSEEYCVLWNHTTSQNSWDKKLHENLRHRDFMQPCKQTSIPIKVHVHLKSFDIDERRGTFIATVLMKLYWRDERISWAPTDYAGVNQIVLPDHHIWLWVPHLLLLNKIDDEHGYEYGECRIGSDGNIIYGLRVVYESYCAAKLVNWPYDVQNCTLEFGNGNKLDSAKFSFEQKGLSMMSLFAGEFSNGWEFISIDSNENLNADVAISLNIVIRRQVYGIAVILISPCFIICVLSGVPIFLNVNDFARLGLLCLSLLFHLIFFSFLHEFLPIGSTDTPVILIFFCGSIIMNTTSIILSCILKTIVKKNAVPFEWMSTICNITLDSVARYLIIPRWNINALVVDQDTELKNKYVWINFANILNSVYLFIFILVYICLFKAYLPSHL